MTKGKLLALDTPLGIKKQFGFGYKLLVEPKQHLNLADFIAMTRDTIGSMILSEENVGGGFAENSDSRRSGSSTRCPSPRATSCRAS